MKLEQFFTDVPSAPPDPDAPYLNQEITRLGAEHFGTDMVHIIMTASYALVFNLILEHGIPEDLEDIANGTLID